MEGKKRLSRLISGDLLAIVVVGDFQVVLRGSLPAVGLES